MSDSTASAAVRETPTTRAIRPVGELQDSAPKVVSGRAVEAYRDIRATGAPPAVKRCWRAIAERLPDDGEAELCYRLMAARARCGRRTAMAAVAFGVAVGCIKRTEGKLGRYPGDYWNRANRYRWIGPPREPILRGQFRAFVNPNLARV